MARSRVSSEYAQEIGARIVQARLELDGMTQKELADLLHVSQRSAQAYEAGEVIPYARMSDLADILGVTQKWLLHGDDNSVSPTEMLAEMRNLTAINGEVLKEIRKIAARLGE